MAHFALLALIFIAAPHTARSQTFKFNGDFPLSTATREGNTITDGPTFNAFYRTGDGLKQSYIGTGVANITSVSLLLNYSRNNLSNSGFVNFNVNLIGAVTTTIGVITVNQATGTGNNTYNFFSPAVAGAGAHSDNYTFEIVETNTVPDNSGSVGIAFANAGTTTLAFTGVAAMPEPGSIALLALGYTFVTLSSLPVVSMIARRRRKSI